MTRPVFYLIGAAAAVTVAIGAWNLLPRSPSTGGPTVAPSPTVLPSATKTVRAVPDGPVAGGTYGFNPLSSVPSLRVEATVPAGWQGVPVAGHQPCSIVGWAEEGQRRHHQ